MLYENQQIGNFNYLLGYCLGKNNFQKPFSINTYQQTYGHDKTIGDMFGNIGGKYYILEFKRSENEFVTELKKEQRVKLIEKILVDTDMQTLSLKGHFLCTNTEYDASDISSKEKKKISVDYKLIPYYSLVKEINNNNILPSFTVIDGVMEFAMNIAFNKVKYGKEHIGMDYNELKRYLAMMKDCVGDDDYETTGTVACFNSESGEIVSLKFESLKELDKQLNLGQDYFMDRNKVLESKKTPQLPPPSKNKGKGFYM